MSVDRPRLYPSTSTETGRYPFSRDRLFLTCGLASALLFWAALDDHHSDGFYTFLRIYVCGLSILWAVLFWFLERPAWSLAAVCAAILFNPIFEIHFEDGDWALIDFAAGAVFGWIALQPYAVFRSKPLVPYLPAIVMGGIALFAAVDFRTSSGFAASEPTMNVDETLTLDEMAENAVTAADADMPAWQLAPPASDYGAAADTLERLADSATVEGASPPPRERRVDYSQDWLNMRPDGSVAPKPESKRANESVDKAWLDEVLKGRSKPIENSAVENDVTAMDSNSSMSQ